MSITRYHPPKALNSEEGKRQFQEMLKGATGDYVTYGDHLVRIHTLQDEIKKLKDKLEITITSQLESTHGN